MEIERVQLFDEIPRIEGEHVLLRPLRDTDADALAEFYGLRQPAHKVSIGYRLLERYWDRGIASETVALMLDYLFGRTDILLVTASTLPDNLGSARVLQKNGFVLHAQNSPEDWGFEEDLPTDKWHLTKPA